MGARYGVEISQSGVPLDRAADYQKNLDDRWPYLDIALEIDIDITKSDWAVGAWVLKVADHNLGYVPMYTFRPDDPSIYATDYRLYPGRMYATKKSFYIYGWWLSFDSTTPIRIKGKLRVFSADCTKGFVARADSISPYGVSPKTDYGVKILKNNSGGRRINNGELSRFSINTTAKALAIHKLGLQLVDDQSSTTDKIYHDIGYPPTYLFSRYFYNGAPAVTAQHWDLMENPDAVTNPINVSLFFRVEATTTYLKLKGVQSTFNGYLAYIIVKDPAEVAK